MSDEIIEAVREIITDTKETATGPLKDIKRIYYGDPILIPASNLPAICIMPGNITNSSRGSRYDTNSGNMKIKLVFNIKDSIEDANPQEVKFVKEAVKLMEGKEGQIYSPESIMGIIRKNPTLKNTIQVMQNVSIDYNFEGKRASPTYDATMDISFIGISQR